MCQLAQHLNHCSGVHLPNWLPPNDFNFGGGWGIITDGGLQKRILEIWLRDEQGGHNHRSRPECKFMEVVSQGLA